MRPHCIGPVTLARMHTRAEVYSPLQNTAVWLAAWLYNVESADDTVDALTDLGGAHSYGSLPIAHFLHDVRSAADLSTPGPAIRLVLWGPGQAPRLRAGSPAMEALTQAGALVVRGAGMHHILVPEYSGNGVNWRWFEDPEPLPEPD